MAINRMTPASSRLAGKDATSDQPTCEVFPGDDSSMVAAPPSALVPASTSSSPSTRSEEARSVLSVNPLDFAAKRSTCLGRDRKSAASACSRACASPSGREITESSKRCRNDRRHEHGGDQHSGARVSRLTVVLRNLAYMLGVGRLLREHQHKHIGNQDRSGVDNDQSERP